MSKSDQTLKLVLAKRNLQELSPLKEKLVETSNVQDALISNDPVAYTVAKVIDTVREKKYDNQKALYNELYNQLKVLL